MSHFLRQDEAEGTEGQATFEMANLRPQQTGLSFVVWVSQRDGAKHDIRVKVGYHPKVFPSQMGVYAVRPFAFVTGQQLLTKDERLLEAWISKNADVLLGYWNADIAYTDELFAQIQPI